MQMNIGIFVLLLLLCLHSGTSLFPLQLRSKKIPTISLTSSRSDLNTGPENARWESAKAWCTIMETKPKSKIYLEVNLGKEYDITTIETLGWSARKKKVTKCLLYYKKDGRWVPYRETLRIKIFRGGLCHSSNRPSQYLLKEPIIAKHLRFYPFSNKVETGCLKIRIYGNVPLQSDCVRVGSNVIFKNVNDRPIAYLPGQIVGFSKHHIFVKVRNSKDIIRIDKKEDHPLIKDKVIIVGSLRRNDRVLALFRYYDRYYEGSVQYTYPPTYVYVQNEAFYSPSEWLTYRYLKSFDQAYLCHCTSCDLSSSLEEACDMTKYSYDYGVLIKTIQITEGNNNYQYILGDVQDIYLNKRRAYIVIGGTKRFRYNPSITNNCLCPYLKVATTYAIFGVVKNQELVIDSTSKVKETDRTSNMERLCTLTKY